MTLAEFYATHESPQAIIVPRRGIRVGGRRSEINTDSKREAHSAASSSADGAAGKKQ